MSHFQILDCSIFYYPRPPTEVTSELQWQLFLHKPGLGLHSEFDGLDLHLYFTVYTEAFVPYVRFLPI